MRTLTSRGLAVERRPYFLVKRGIATTGLYIARFGQDLYISQVTYAKGPISPLRVVVLSTMVLLLVLQIALPFLYGGALILDDSDLTEVLSAVLGPLAFVLCCIGPVAVLNPIGLLLAGLHVIYKTFTDRDPLALLRTPPNEFEQDDIIALEKAVEETVRQSLDAIGIDAALMPPAPEYGIRRRLI